MPKKEMSSEQIELFNELKKLSKRANQRIVRLERSFGKDTWATKRLKNKLEVEPLQAWTRSGRVKVNKSMTVDQLKATIKATKQFLKYPTSTIKGVKQARKSAIQKIKERINIDKDKFTYEDAENFYDMFDSAYNWILEYITPSEFEAMIVDAIDERDSQDDWINRIETYIVVGQDIDLVQKCISLYDKFVAPYI